MSTDAVDEFRRRLELARRDLLRTVVQTDEELATLEAHQPGAPGEDVNTALFSAILSRLQGWEKHALDEIADAEARLAAGAYGTCEDCGQTVPLARLRAVPTARLCVGCQRKHET